MALAAVLDADVGFASGGVVVYGDEGREGEFEGAERAGDGDGGVVERAADGAVAAVSGRGDDIEGYPGWYRKWCAADVRVCSWCGGESSMRCGSRVSR